MSLWSSIKKIVHQITNVVEDTVKGVWDATTDFATFIVKFQVNALTVGLQVLFRDILAPVFKPIFALLGITDETIYSTEVITSPLIDKKAKYLKQTIYNAIRNDLDLAEEIRFATLTSPLSTVRSYFQYGENTFIDRLPTVTVSEYFSDKEGVISILENIVGEAITISSTEFGKPVPKLWVQNYLIDNNNYSMETNILTLGAVNWGFVDTVLNVNKTAYIANITRNRDDHVVVDNYTQVIYDPTEFTDTWTRTTTYFSHNYSDPSDFNNIIVDTNHIRTPTTTGAPASTTFINISHDITSTTENATLGTEIALPGGDAYYGVVYTLNSNPAVKQIWFYDTITGTYPELNNSVIGGDTDNLQTLPILALRKDFVNIDTDKESDTYITSKKALDILGLIKVDTLIAAINDNPDIDKIKNAYVLFGSNLYNEDVNNLKYLYLFFTLLSVLPKFNKADFEALSPLDKSNSTFIYTISEGKYNTALSCNYIESTEIQGYIGKLGSIEIETIILPNTVATVTDIQVRSDPAQQHSEDSLGLVNSIFKIRTQSTNNTYTEIEVSGLTLTTYLITHGTSVDIKVIELVDKTTGSISDKANFIIPVSYYVLKQLIPSEAEQVIYDSIQLVIYAQDSVHLAYYETPQFIKLISIVIQIAAIIVFIFTLGEGAALSEVLLQLAAQLLIQVGLQFALREVLKHNLSDEEKAVVFALFIAASFYGANAFNPDQVLVFADIALLSVNSISTFVEVDTQVKTNELLKQQEEFNSLATTKNEELKAAQDYLTTDGIIDTELLLNSRTIPKIDTWSTPEQFYDKSLLTNVAPIIIDRASTYVSSVLDLDNIKPIFDSTVDPNIGLFQELT